MSTTWAAVWGVLGGLCVELLELYGRIHRTPKWNWREPIPQGMIAYLISVTIRVGIGAVVAAAAAASGQVSGTLTAFGLGAAAPLVIEKLSRAVPPIGQIAVSAPLAVLPIQPDVDDRRGAVDAR